MNWISVEKELPKTRSRFLAICENGVEDSRWFGIVDVYFDPHIGWSRCESKDIKPICVNYYIEHPYPDYPWTPIEKSSKDQEGR